MKEFKDFAVKGNVVDMAVGIVIGVAFGNIITVFVSGVIMPPIGVLLGWCGLFQSGDYRQRGRRRNTGCTDQLWSVHSNSYRFYYYRVCYFYGF